MEPLSEQAWRPSAFVGQAAVAAPVGENSQLQISKNTKSVYKPIGLSGRCLTLSSVA